LPEYSVEDLVRAPFTTRHRGALDAALADLADVVPLVGEVAGLARLAEALERDDGARAAMEAGDLLLGFPPVIGDILDLLTPTNLLFQLRGEGRIKL
jgi:hypothetical protein